MLGCLRDLLDQVRYAAARHAEVASRVIEHTPVRVVETYGHGSGRNGRVSTDMSMHSWNGTSWEPQILTEREE